MHRPDLVRGARPAHHGRALMTLKTHKESIEAMVKAAQELRRQAGLLNQAAEALCAHRNDDGSFAVNRGQPFITSPCCAICELDDCYIPIYSRVSNNCE